MPEISQLLKERSRETGIRLDILEKDYALSYLLTAITATPGLGEQVVLKGGLPCASYITQVIAFRKTWITQL